MTPSLSLVGIVRDAASHLPQWIERGRAYADEIVVCVDSASRDDTFGVASSLADQALLFENSPSGPGPGHDWAMRQARGEWIVRLDDDECLSSQLIAALPNLLKTRELTHYYIPRRWVVRTDTGLGWLDRPPWNPEWALRLHRNVGSIWRHCGGLHERVDVDGQGVYLDPNTGVMWHLDLAWRTYEERAFKVRCVYDKVAPWVPTAQLYLWENSARPQDVRPVPPGELEGFFPTVFRKPWSADDDEANHRSDPGACSLASQLLIAAQHAQNPPIFSAQFLAHDVPARLEAGRPREARVVVRNTSATGWRNTGRPQGRVFMRHRWARDDGDLSGPPAPLPSWVERGRAATVRVALWPPDKPGRYRLILSLEAEGIASFDDRGVEPLTVDVELATDSV